MTTPEIKVLPDWLECERACEAGTASPLQSIIYHDEPEAPDDHEFRQRLITLLNSLDPTHTWQESP